MPDTQPSSVATAPAAVMVAHADRAAAAPEAMPPQDPADRPIRFRSPLVWVALLLAALWLLALLAGPQALPALGLRLNAHGHTHLYTHGHPFADARTLWGIPNGMDVLTNLPFLLAGLLGLVLLGHRKPPPGHAVPLGLFAVGLLLTAAGSAYYHWAPDASGLMLDRMGMAVAFAGVLALVLADRLHSRAGAAGAAVLLPVALLSAVLPFARDQLLPWAVLQFGGMGLVVVAALSPQRPGGLGVAWWGVVGWYALAKALELGDAAVFAATSGLIAGHSAKHLTAALAAWPVLSALARCPRPATCTGAARWRGTAKAGGVRVQCRNGLQTRLKKVSMLSKKE